MNEIAKIVAEYHGINPQLLQSKTRKRKIMFPRQIAMYLLRQRSGLTLKQIGGFFQKDHASVLHSVKVIENLMDAYPEFREDIAFLLEYTSDIKITDNETICKQMKFPKKAVKI